MAGYCRPDLQGAQSTWSVTYALFNLETGLYSSSSALKREPLSFVMKWPSLSLLSRDLAHTCIADINTRSGLKKIHRDFDTIHRMLNTLYAVTYSDKVAGAVVGIFGKLAEDGILLRRIIKETGIVDLSCYQTATYSDAWL